MGNHNSEVVDASSVDLSGHLRCGRRRFERSETNRPLFTQSVLRRMQACSWKVSRDEQAQDRLRCAQRRLAILAPCAAAGNSGSWGLGH